jgi:hypothetical protein
LSFSASGTTAASTPFVSSTLFDSGGSRVSLSGVGASHLVLLAWSVALCYI